MDINGAKELIEFCKGKGIKNIALGNFHVEFFLPTPPETDVTAISKTLIDSIPPDSAMLFASTEDPVNPNYDSTYIEATGNNDMK